MKSLITTALAFTFLPCTIASADLLISFDEGAPKDRFTFENTGTCPIKNSNIKLDLSGSSAGLIFDVTASGAGVEVYQPLEFVAGEKNLLSIPKVRDGDTAVSLEISELAAGEAVAFTIDVDDTLGGREITVSNSEISGASVTLSSNGISDTTNIDATSKAVLPLKSCENS